MFRLPRRWRRRDRRGASPPREPIAVTCGDWSAREFAWLRGELDSCGAWRHAASLDAAAVLAETDQPPDVVLVAEPRPGCVLQGEVDRLLAHAPLVRVAVVAGSWCEGQWRTGRPLAGVIRLYWHETPAWWRAGCQAAAAGAVPAWSAPLDRPRAGGAWEASPASAPPARANRRRAAINAPSFATYEAIAAALAPFGWDAAWHERGRSRLAELADVGAAVWDGGQLDPAELAALAQFRRGLGASPRLVVLLDFPRGEHPAAAVAAGATCVLGKPYPIDALAAALEAQ